MAIIVILLRLMIKVISVRMQEKRLLSSMVLRKTYALISKYVIDAPFLRLYKIDAVIDKFDTIVDSKYLINEEEESESVKIRQVLLPLGNKESITHILGVITFKLL